MKSAEPCANEAERLHALQALQILDTPPDPVLDGLVRVAAQALACPIGLLSLVDSDRQWFKSARGVNLHETPRELGFCPHAILGDGVFEVPDARADARFADNPMVVGEPGVRFYAGMPVGTGGHRFGTLCVIDRVPRTLTDAERGTLVDLAHAVDQWLAQRAAHLALGDSERSFRELAEQTPAIVYRADLTPLSRTRYISPRIADLGYTPQDWIDHPDALWRAIHRDDFARVRSTLDELVASGGVCTMQFRLRDSSGGWHAMQSTTRVIHSDDGRPLALQGVMVDVTESMGQQAWLRKLSAAVDQAAETVIITDLNGTIEYVNDAGLRQSGYARDELVGRHPSVLQSGETPQSVYVELWKSLTEGRPWQGVLHNQRKDGSALLESATISPVRDAAGRVTHYMAVKQDVTETHSLRAQLDHYREHLDALVTDRTAALERARADAEAANAAKSGFLAAMSHEIRTPMSGVIGVIELLERSSLTPDQKELTDTARESAATLLALIDDILDFSKIEAGRMALEAAPMDPAQIAEGACDMLQPVANDRGVQLHVFADPALPSRLTGDAVRVRQIITNLVGNAIKFSAGGERPGRVSLRVQWRPAAGLVIGVADNGIGMSTEVQKRLFRPFEQAERSTTRQFGGTGLGLVICRRLTDAMGGRIEVTSTPGQGSHFEVTLPLAEAPAPVPAGAAVDLAGLHCKLLVTDDEWAHDWAAYLRAAGAQVQRASAPPDANDAPTVWVAQAGLLDAAAQPGAAVVLRRGERRTPREEAPGRVSIDMPGMRRDALVLAVALAAGRAVPAERPTAAAPTHTRLQGVSVLVAEDNATNRKVLARQLSLLGVSAEFAEDGQAALERWRADKARHALLLTDLHMPRLDGYALCAAIRGEEGPGRRLPIVALTANALRGESDRCKAAGMDDYLSKPVQIERLRATLLRWTASTAEATLPATTPKTRPRTRAMDFDPHALERMVGNDATVLADLRQSYLANADDDLAEIHAAIASGNWERAGAVAHRWKSSSRALGALALGQLLEELELAGRQARGDAARELAEGLDAALLAVRNWLGAATPTLPGRPGRHVLLVDDDPFQLTLIAQMLQACQATDTESFEGAEALLARLAQGGGGQDCLALIDLNMPGMDGIELVRHLAESGYQGALAVLSNADQRVLQTAVRLAQARGLRVLGYLHKPVLAPELDALLERWKAAPGEIAAKADTPRTVDEVRHAIEGGELRLLYQPQVDLKTGALCGVEALVRWLHPRDGLLPPSCFVPVAEQHGLIDALTRRVLDLALSQARHWRRRNGLAVKVSVNVSMDNLAQLDFPEYVTAELARHEVPAHDLVLEVTETRLMKDVRAPLDILTRLRLRGINLSIDDFGTGHSSLAQLRDLPFGELKIDQGFVRGGQGDASRRAILSGSVAMGRQLGMHVVAEGVEDVADWELVRGAGCTAAQGYLIARPMRGEELPPWLASWPLRHAELLAEPVA